MKERTAVNLSDEMLAWDAASDEALINFEGELDSFPCDECEAGWGGSFTDSAGQPLILSCEDTCKWLADWRSRNPILNHTVLEQ